MNLSRRVSLIFLCLVAGLALVGLVAEAGRSQVPNSAAPGPAGARGATFSRVLSGVVATDLSWSRGPAWGDFDGDGDADLFIANEGEPDFFYRNEGDGSFVRLTTGPGILLDDYSTAASWADYDRDGLLDLFVSGDSDFTGGFNHLWHNDGGANFSLVSSGVLVSDVTRSEGAAWADFDSDGRLDLLVANGLGTADANYLYRGSGRPGDPFTRVVSGPVALDLARSLSASWADYDNDGDLDLFVANYGQSNRLYRNEGGIFSPTLFGPGAGDVGPSTGASWADYDNDGDLDLLVTNDGHPNFLFRNEWPAAGPLGWSQILTGPVVSGSLASRGSSWADYDNDADLDLFVANYGQANQLFRNLGDGRFGVVAGNVVVTDPGASSSGAAWADYDLDGDLDLVVANWWSADLNYLYRNEGNGNNWLQVDLRGRWGDPGAIGTRLWLFTIIGGRPVWQMREVSAQSGFAGQDSATVEFGLGDGAIVYELAIRWPSGATENLRSIVPNQRVSLREPWQVRLPMMFR